MDEMPLDQFSTIERGLSSQWPQNWLLWFSSIGITNIRAHREAVGSFNFRPPGIIPSEEWSHLACVPVIGSSPLTSFCAALFCWPWNGSLS